MLGHRLGEGRRAVVASVVQAGLVAGTLVVLGESVRHATLVGVGFLALTLALEGSELLFGDYAGNVLLGVLAVALGGWLVAGGATLVGAVGGLVGVWFVVDGVQHRRYGLARTPVVRGVSEESGGLRALPRLLVDRLLEPFRLTADD